MSFRIKVISWFYAFLGYTEWSFMKDHFSLLGRCQWSFARQVKLLFACC